MWQGNGRVRPSANGDHRTLTLADYEAVGGLALALSSHADEAWYELETDEQRRIAEVLFRRLTERSVDYVNNAAVRHRCSKWQRLPASCTNGRRSCRSLQAPGPQLRHASRRRNAAPEHAARHHPREPDWKLAASRCLGASGGEIGRDLPVAGAVRAAVEIRPVRVVGDTRPRPRAQLEAHRESHRSVGLKDTHRRSIRLWLFSTRAKPRGTVTLPSGSSR